MEALTDHCHEVRPDGATLQAHTEEQKGPHAVPLDLPRSVYNSPISLPAPLRLPLLHMSLLTEVHVRAAYKRTYTGDIGKDRPKPKAPVPALPRPASASSSASSSSSSSSAMDISGAYYSQGAAATSSVATVSAGSAAAAAALASVAAARAASATPGTTAVAVAQKPRIRAGSRGAAGEQQHGVKDAEGQVVTHRFGSSYYNLHQRDRDSHERCAHFRCVLRGHVSSGAGPP